MIELSVEEKLRNILNDESLFGAEKKVAVLKAIAEEKCRISPKRLKKLGEEAAEQKREKCIKRKTADLWWTFLRQREPVQVGHVTVKLEDSEIKIEKSGEV